LDNKEYDALILGYGGVKRLSFENKVSQVFSIDEILPPACQALIGLQTRDENSELINLISNTNHKHSSIIGITERNVLEILGVNCNSPIGVYASINENKILLKIELFSHNGKEKYKAEGIAKLTDFLNLADKVSGMIVDQVGTKYIEELEILKDDFNYTP
jgi:hydroxymethylbilane synthase